MEGIACACLLLKDNRWVLRSQVSSDESCLVPDQGRLVIENGGHFVDGGVHDSLAAYKALQSLLSNTIYINNDIYKVIYILREGGGYIYLICRSNSICV